MGKQDRFNLPSSFVYIAGHKTGTTTMDAILKRLVKMSGVPKAWETKEMANWEENAESKYLFKDPRADGLERGSPMRAKCRAFLHYAYDHNISSNGIFWCH